MNNKIKSLGFVLMILLIISVLVIVRSTRQNLFKQDVKTVVAASYDGKNSITYSQMNNRNAKYTVVDLSTSEAYDSNKFNASANIPFNALLEKENQKKLKETKDTLVLFSENMATASKAWVILHQLGFTNVYILKTEANSEVFKYKFQPDTSAKPE